MLYDKNRYRLVLFITKLFCIETNQKYEYIDVRK